MHFFGHAYSVEIEFLVGLIEQAEDDSFAEDGGDDGEADVDFFCADADGCLAVLWCVSVGDVEFGHDFES